MQSITVMYVTTIFQPNFCFISQPRVISEYPKLDCPSYTLLIFEVIKCALLLSSFSIFEYSSFIMCNCFYRYQLIFHYIPLLWLLHWAGFTLSQSYERKTLPRCKKMKLYNWKFKFIYAPHVEHMFLHNLNHANFEILLKTDNKKSDPNY